MTQQPGNWSPLLHLASVSAAAVAAFDAMVTLAGPDQARPRLLAMALAAGSVLACAVGWRWFGPLARFDSLLALACSAWVLAYGAW